MTRKYTKAEAIGIVVRCAQTYKQELDGKNLLFICTDKHKKTIPIELSFYGNNYLHLTGLKAPKSENGDIAVELFANDFYQKCLDHKLSPTDFDFAEDGTTHMKLDVLPTVISKNLQAKMIGNYDSIKPRLYTEKVAGSTNACIGFVLDQDMQQYVPNTVVKEDLQGQKDRFFNYRFSGTIWLFEAPNYIKENENVSLLMYSHFLFPIWHSVFLPVTLPQWDRGGWGTEWSPHHISVWLSPR